MSKENLTAEQLQDANDLDKTLKKLANIKEQLKHYKLGDVYVLEEWYKNTPDEVVVYETSMGFPAKYKVVYISDQGIPYLRKLTGTGNPTGDAMIPPEAVAVAAIKRSTNGTNLLGHQLCQRFVPDPEQLDSILLQQDFVPMAQHRDKSKLYNEINKHNKSIAISTYDFNKIANFFKSKNPGDTFWTTPDKQFVIQSVVKVGTQYVITCTDMNQQTVTFNFSHFFNTRLYKDQPRSFGKESKK